MAFFKAEEQLPDRIGKVIGTVLAAGIYLSVIVMMIAHFF